MKKILCKYSECGDRRVHYEHPDVPRGTVRFEVPDDVQFGYCSHTCALMDGYMSLRTKDGIVFNEHHQTYIKFKDWTQVDKGNHLMSETSTRE